MPRAGRWLEEAGGSHSDVSNNVQDLSMMGHVVVVGSPYHNARGVVLSESVVAVWEMGGSVWGS